MRRARDSCSVRTCRRTISSAAGKQIGVGLNRSKYLTDVRFSYVDPYFTEDGVSRGFSVYYRKAELGKINIANYTTSSDGGNMTFGYPLSETATPVVQSRLRRARTIDAGYATPLEIIGSPSKFKDVNHYYDAVTNADGSVTYGDALPLDSQYLYNKL